MRWGYTLLQRGIRCGTDVGVDDAALAKVAGRLSPFFELDRRLCSPPSTNASTLIRPSWRRDGLAVNPRGNSGPSQNDG